MLTECFDRALVFANRLHEGHTRKGTDVPYVSHLLQVSGLVLELGGDEDEAIAGLLHDGPEDRGGEPTLARIEAEFGPRVAQIVRENSDSLAESPDEKEEWRLRKEAYLAAIPHKSPSACLVSICDKVHNARSLLMDSQAFGDTHWDRFNAGKADALWYYRSLVEAFAVRAEGDARIARGVRLLDRIVTALEAT